MQERKITKELTKLKDIYDSFCENDVQRADINLIFEEKYKKCDKHKKIKYFFCDNHRDSFLMCNDCCDDHVRNSNDKINQHDIDKHSFYYFPFFILRSLEERLIDLNKVNISKDDISTVCNAITNYKRYLDYNYYYVNNLIEEKFTELSRFLNDFKSKLKQDLLEKYKKNVEYI